LSRCTFLVLAVCLLQTSGALGVDDGFAAARQGMIEEIQATVAETRRETGRARLAIGRSRLVTARRSRNPISSPS